MVYFIQSGTTVKLASRLKVLCKASGQKLRVLAVLPGSFPEENALHRQFAHLRVVNEWFEPGDDLLGFIVAEGREWDGADEGEWEGADEGSCRTLPAGLDAEVIRQARIVAEYHDVTVAEYLSKLLRPLVSRDRRARDQKIEAAKQTRYKVSGSILASNMYRLGYGDIVIRSAEVARLVTEKTGQSMSRQRIGTILNAVSVNPETIATLAKALGVKPSELTKAETKAKP